MIARLPTASLAAMKSIPEACRTGGDLDLPNLVAVPASSRVGTASGPGHDGEEWPDA